MYTILVAVRGAWLPYLISWTLYKGHVLIMLVNWAGLVVNGLVCYVLPLLLVFKALSSRQEQYDSIGYDDDDCNDDDDDVLDDDDVVDDVDSTAMVSYQRSVYPLHHLHQSHSLRNAQIQDDDVYPLPSYWDAYRRTIVMILMLFIMILMAQTLVLEAIMV